MLCTKCKTEMYMDHYDKDNNRLAMVCINPKCEDYNKAKYSDGEDAPTTIKQPNQ